MKLSIVEAGAFEGLLSDGPFLGGEGKAASRDWGQSGIFSEGGPDEDKP